jgi:hypothetical protein
MVMEKDLFDPENPFVIICDLELENALQVRALHALQVRDYVLTQMTPTDVSLSEEERKTVPTTLLIHLTAKDGKTFPIPMWASPHARAVVFKANARDDYNTNGLFEIEHTLCEILLTAPGNFRKRYYTYREVIGMVARYISHNKESILEPRNSDVGILDNSTLQIVTGTRTIARSQLHYFMQNFLRRVEAPGGVPTIMTYGHTQAPITPDSSTN